MRCAIPPGALETIEQPAIGMEFEPLHGNRGSGTIARQTFQARHVFGVHRNVRVQTEAIHAGAARTESRIHALGVDLITHSSHTTTALGPYAVLPDTAAA